MAQGSLKREQIFELLDTPNSTSKEESDEGSYRDDDVIPIDLMMSFNIIQT